MPREGRPKQDTPSPTQPPANVVSLIPAGKLRCCITGVLRPDKPEEHVRQRWARSLIDEYGYKASDIAVEFRIKMGSTSKRVDLAIFKPGAPKKQENIFIVIEAKRDDVQPNARNEGVEQLKSYVAACSSCRYGLWVGTEKIAVEKMSDGALEDIVDLPRSGSDEPRIPEYTDLVPAIDLKATLRRCHNYIYSIRGSRRPKRSTNC